MWYSKHTIKILMIRKLNFKILTKTTHRLQLQSRVNFSVEAKRQQNRSVILRLRTLECHIVYRCSYIWTQCTKVFKKRKKAYHYEYTSFFSLVQIIYIFCNYTIGEYTLKEKIVTRQTNFGRGSFLLSSCPLFYLFVDMKYENCF